MNNVSTILWVDMCPPTNTWFLWPTQLYAANIISICASIFAILLRAPGHDAPLIRFLISALYVLFACLYHMLPHLFFFLHFSLFISSHTWIDLLHFLARCRKRQVVVHFFWLVNACFCCVRFIFFSIPSQNIGFRKRLLFCFEWDVKPQLNQSVNHNISILCTVGQERLPN